MKPCMMGVATNAKFGSDKILFPVMCSSTMCTEDYDYVVVEYPEPFTFAVEDIGFDFDYSKEPWFDNYYYTYRYSQSKKVTIIAIYRKDGNKFTKIESAIDPTSFQNGDATTEKITLSNGDILFNNFGDVNSGLLFCKTRPKIKLYKSGIEDEIKIMEEINKNDHYDAVDVDEKINCVEHYKKLPKTTQRYFID